MQNCSCGMYKEARYKTVLVVCIRKVDATVLVVCIRKVDAKLFLWYV